MAIIPSITTWNRVEPRPRSNQFGASLAAQVRDPAWFLCRQWQTGEFTGQDAGSPAFLTVATTSANMTSWSVGSASAPIKADSPLEKQTLAEPFSAGDLSISVEVGQTFRALLDPVDAATTYALFLDHFPIAAPSRAPTDFNPLDAETRGFLTVCAGQALDGAAVYALAKQHVLHPTDPLPSWIPSSMLEAVKTSLTNLYTWVQSVWGDLGDADPVGWSPHRLEYSLQLQGEAPDGSGIVFDAHPDPAGELPWSSFDVSPTSIPPPAGFATNPHRVTMVPGHVRFRCMPSPRFWDFETSEIALPSVKPESRDISKALTLDFLLIHGADWFVAPIPQDLGTLVRVDALVVTDVFGAQTSIGRADTGTTSPGPTRWTLFTPVTPTKVGDFYVCSPTAGSAARAGRPIESVRFARDDMANMAWGIENVTTSPIGRPRPGAERDAAVPSVEPGPSTDTTSPLRYQVETKVPIHWIPLLGAGNPVTDLQVAEMVRPNEPTGGGGPDFVPVPPIGKILNPGGSSAGYLIADEEVPRDGVVVERVVYRSRWIDGSTHLWIGRRRRTGAGETASALLFDVAWLTTK